MLLVRSVAGVAALAGLGVSVTAVFSRSVQTRLAHQRAGRQRRSPLRLRGAAARLLACERSPALCGACSGPALPGPALPDLPSLTASAAANCSLNVDRGTTPALVWFYRSEFPYGGEMCSSERLQERKNSRQSNCRCGLRPAFLKPVQMTIFSKYACPAFTQTSSHTQSKPPQTMQDHAEAPSSRLRNVLLAATRFVSTSSPLTQPSLRDELYCLVNVPSVIH